MLAKYLLRGKYFSPKGLRLHIKPSERGFIVYFRIGFGETWLLQTRNGYLTTYLVRARGGQRQCCNAVLAQELMKHVGLPCVRKTPFSVSIRKELPCVRKTPFSVSISSNHISFLAANGIKQHSCFHNCTWHSAYASLIGHSLCSRFLLFTSRESVYSSVSRVCETCVDIQVTKYWPARNKRPRL